MTVFVISWLKVEGGRYTDKKENQIFLIYKEIRMEQLQSHIWLTTFSHTGKSLRVSSYIRKPFLIYILIYNCSTLNFLIYEENLIFFFISVEVHLYWIYVIEGGTGVLYADHSLSVTIHKSHTFKWEEQVKQTSYFSLHVSEPYIVRGRWAVGKNVL